MFRPSSPHATSLLVVAVHVAALAVVLQAVVWVFYFRGGVGSSVSVVFNWHILLMLGGFLLLQGEASLLYRLRPAQVSRSMAKISHSLLQSLALLLGVLGVWSALRFHNLSNPPIPNFYSLHSWTGLAVLAAFVIQLSVGVYAFLVPSTAQRVRQSTLPWHTFVGALLFILALLTAAQGLVEKMTFLFGAGVAKRGAEAILVNTLGLTLLLWGSLVLLTATHVDKERSDEAYEPLS